MGKTGTSDQEITDHDSNTNQLALQNRFDRNKFIGILREQKVFSEEELRSVNSKQDFKALMAIAKNRRSQNVIAPNHINEQTVNTAAKERAMNENQTIPAATTTTAKPMSFMDRYRAGLESRNETIRKNLEGITNFAIADIKKNPQENADFSKCSGFFHPIHDLGQDIKGVINRTIGLGLALTGTM